MVKHKLVHQFIRSFICSTFTNIFHGGAQVPNVPLVMYRSLKKRDIDIRASKKFVLEGEKNNDIFLFIIMLLLIRFLKDRTCKDLAETLKWTKDNEVTNREEVNVPS